MTSSKLSSSSSALMRQSEAEFDVSFHSHEAIDGRHVVPGAEQEEGQADKDEQAPQVHEEVLNHKPPEAQAPEVDRDVLTLQEQGDRRQR